MKMRWNEVPRPLVVIVGPTAVGKTAVSIELAAHFEGEIISADSRLFYRGMDIGTAKPSPEEMSRVPHHLVDIVDPDQTLNLALFKKMAEDAIADIHARGKLPFLVGGTGQYINALLQDWKIPAQQADTRMRTLLENWAAEIGADGLHKRLRVLDAAAADAIDARNVRRTIRALEVILSTGVRFSAQRTKGKAKYSHLIIGLQRSRPELYARIDARIEAMIQAGLVGEVRSLLERGYCSDLPSLSAIGYREIIQHLQGKISLQEAAALIKRHTRQFVRRQANWFKENDPGIHWFRLPDNDVSDMIVLIESGNEFRQENL